MVTALFCQWFLLFPRGRLMILLGKMFHLPAAGRQLPSDAASVVNTRAICWRIPGMVLVTFDEMTGHFPLRM
jgi:hypothetical protein